MFTLKASLKKVAGSRTQDLYHAFSWVRLVIAYQYLFYKNNVLAISFSMQILLGLHMLRKNSTFEIKPKSFLNIRIRLLNNLMQANLTNT